MRRVEYFEKREPIVVKDWRAAKTILFGLLDNGYRVVVNRERITYTTNYEYLISFINPNWDEATFEVSGDYEGQEMVDGSILKEYKQSINSIDWDNAEKMGQALVDSDYTIMIWTDGETFGGTKPKNYTIHFVHKEDHAHEIRLVE